MFLAKFCIPCIASLIISCLYNIVDQIFVSCLWGERLLRLIGATDAAISLAHDYGFMEHSDAARSNYYRSVTGLPWAHSDNYELCIDSSIGEQACAEMIYAYLGKKGYGKRA